jgi:hypothetical protein
VKAKIYLLSIVSFLLFLLFASPLEAFSQGHGKKQGPPPWAPAHGYRAKTRHIYFPAYNFYFDVQRGVYIYLNSGAWQVATTIPTLYATVNLRNAVQVELDLLTDTPQKYNAEHKIKYKSPGKGNQGKVHAKGPGKPGKGKG